METPLPPCSLDEVARRHAVRSVVRVYDPEEVVHLAGAGGWPGVVESGAIKLVRRDAEGRATIVALAFAGEPIGDLAFMCRRDQPFDAIAASRARVRLMEPSGLEHALAATPGAALSFARHLAARLEHSYAVTADRTSSDATARVAGRVLELAARLGSTRSRGIELDLPIDQEDLARFSGVCRESACKALRALRRAGILDYSRRRMVVRHPERLRDLTGRGRLRHLLDDGIGVRCARRV